MNKSIKEYAVNAAKGFTIGAAMTVPGISGGTLALILDIYDKLVSAVANIFKNFMKNMIFLAYVCISGIVGMFALSSLILWLLSLAPVPIRFFFIGAILGGIAMLFRKTGLKKPDLSFFICIIIGAAVVLAMSFIPEGMTDLSGAFSVSKIPWLCVAGIGLAVAIIAPGISFSHMLLVLGAYESFFSAIKSLDIPFLLSVLIPAGIFTLLLIKLMEFAMTKHPKQTYSVIIGFVLGSIKDIYIGLPNGILSVIITVLTFVAGFLLVLAVTKKAK